MCSLLSNKMRFVPSLKLCPEPPSTVVQFQDVELQAAGRGNWDDKMVVAHGKLGPPDD